MLTVNVSLYHMFLAAIDKPTIPEDTHVPPVVGSDIHRNIPVEEGDSTKGRTTGTDDPGVKMDRKPEDRPTSFFAQPGILAGLLRSVFVSDSGVRGRFSFSCHRRSSRRSPVCYTSGNVYSI